MILLVINKTVPLNVVKLLIVVIAVIVIVNVMLNVVNERRESTSRCLKTTRI